MRNKQNIDYIYKQNLEESIIEYLSKELRITTGNGYLL